MMQYRQGGRAGENHQIYQIRLDLYNTLDLLIFRGKVRLSRGASPSCSLVEQETFCARLAKEINTAF